jgi:glycosyltransferase involved in cell wall biosynthesis
MNTPVAYDVTRLFIAPLSRTPRGIDRVDLAYAEHVFITNEKSVAVLPTPWGIRCFTRERALAGLSRLRQLWAENISADDDDGWLALRQDLLGAPRTAPAGKRGSKSGSRSTPMRFLSLLSATGLTIGKSVRADVPSNAVYLSVGQIGLAFPFLLRWLNARTDVTPVFMLHDVIPIETPEYVEPKGVSGHTNMVAATARYARGLIVTTQTARDAVERELAMRGRTALPTFARALPPSPDFGRHVEPDPALATCRYFVACATLEPRKNLELLAEVWKRLVAEQGEAAPHLVIVGARGFTGDQIVARLQRAPSTAGRLHIVHGLSTPALARLMAGACALLSPSLIEGFGLPLVEAQALGTLVIASDIPSHREIAGPGALLIDPFDAPSWKAAIKCAKRERDMSTPQVHDDWTTYFGQFENWLRIFEGSDNLPLGWAGGSGKAA